MPYLHMPIKKTELYPGVKPAFKSLHACKHIHICADTHTQTEELAEGLKEAPSSKEH